jgi:hypothetical protein
MEPVERLSLMDTAYAHPANFALVYSPRDETSAWWTRALEPQFVHVEVWRRLEEDIWIAIQPHHDYLGASLVQGHPEGVVQTVQARRRLRRPLFPIGLKTCVTIAKAALGIRDATIITPAQLYCYVARRNGIV